MALKKIVVFAIGGQDYGADIGDVREVIRAPATTPLPHPTPPVVGVFNLRGDIVTALDGHAALGLQRERSEPTRAVIFHSAGRAMGLLVDSASHVLTVDEAKLKPTPEEEGQPLQAILIHEGRPIVILDIPQLLEKKKLISTRPLS